MRRKTSIGRDVTASGGTCHAHNERLAQIASNATSIIEFANASGRRPEKINKTSILLRVGAWRVLLGLMRG